MKNRSRFIFVLGLVLILSFSFVSASLFSDMWNKFTGEVVKGGNIAHSVVPTDSTNVSKIFPGGDSPPKTGRLKISIKSFSNGLALENFSFWLYNSKNNLIDFKIGEFGSVSFDNLIIPKMYFYQVSKKGYENKSGSILIKRKINYLNFEMDEETLFEVSISTLKDTYSVGEQINLTDPPEKKENSKIGLTGNFLANRIGKRNDNSFSNGDFLGENSSKKINYLFRSEKNIFEDERFKEIIPKDVPKYSGYIIEFEEKPIIKEYSRLKKEAEKNKGSFLEGIPLIRNFLILDENVDKRLNDYKFKFNKKHEETKQKILSKINKKVDSEFKNVFNGISLNLSDEEAMEIRNMHGVKKVYPNYEVHATLMDSVPQIGADKVWQLNSNLSNCSLSKAGSCLTGKGVTIGIIDTGVDYTHGDLGNCTTQQFLSGNCSKVVGGYDFVNDDDDPMDDMGHGTHVAATAAGNGDWNHDGILKPGEGLNGVAPGAEIIAYKVLSSSGSGSISGIISAIERSVDPNQDGKFSDHLDVISLSLGGPGNPDDPMSQAIDLVVEAGVVAVIAAGNSGPWEQTIGSPGNARKAITVGAVDKQDKIADFSSRGPVIWEDENGKEKALMKPDVVAPGVNICAAQAYFDPWNDRLCLDDKHVAISGTSMATPHVAGAVALLKQKNPDWSVEEIKSSLKGTGVNIGEDIVVQGWGRIDILEAVGLEEPFPIGVLKEIYVENLTAKIIGVVKSDSFESYSLYYKLERENQWSQITNSTFLSKNEILYDWDISFLPEGDYLVKLIIRNMEGRESEDIIPFNINRIKLTKPLNNDIFKIGKKIEIKGSIILAENEYYLIKVFKENGERLENTIELVDGGQGTISKGTIAYFNTKNITETGGYFLDIKVIKRQKGKDLILGGAYLDLFLDLNLKEGWPKYLSFKSEFGRESINEDSGVSIYEPIMKDLNGDGTLELIFSEEVSGDREKSLSKILVLDANGDFLEGWPVTLPLESCGLKKETLIVGDINKDGFNEIILSVDICGETVRRKILIYNFEGELLNSFFPNDELLWTHEIEGLAMDDIDGDGTMDIVALGVYSAYTSDGQVDECRIYVLDQFGENKQGWPKTFECKYTNSNLAIGDINNDSYKEIIVTGNMNMFGPSKIFIYDYKGSIVKRWSMNESIQVPPIIGDINNDGINEIIVVSLYGAIHIFDEKGNYLSGWPMDLSGELSRVYTTSPVIGNFFGEGIKIAIGGAVKGGKMRIFLLNKKGVVEKGWPKEIMNHPRNAFNVPGKISLADVDGDGVLDILATGYNSVSAWNEEGILIDGFPLIQSYTSGSNPLIFDFDNDGKIEIISFSNGEYDFDKSINKHRSGIYVWDLDSLYTVSIMDWPQFQHDAQHTGCYECDIGATSPPILPQSKIVNNGNESLNGTLNLILQKKFGEKWKNIKVVTNESVGVPAGGLIKLDVGDSYGWNLKNISARDSGRYRVYVSFDTQNQKKETSWEFDVL